MCMYVQLYTEHCAEQKTGRLCRDLHSTEDGEHCAVQRTAGQHLRKKLEHEGRSPGKAHGIPVLPEESLHHIVIMVLKSS